ncbi:MAG: NAD(P)-dependent oxidoreductase, partial [Acidimicrobiales bacterium]
VVGLRRRARPTPLAGVTVCPDLPSLLRLSDHVVVAAPATPRTDGLLDDDALGHVKPGAHLVNVARGSLVDQDALVRALDDGRIARASLDVTDPEPLPGGHVLFHHERVRITPHISWSSPRTVQRTLDLFTENVTRYRSGKELLGVVDVEEGY